MSDLLRPLPRNALHEDVARVMREMILKGEFRERQKVPVKELAAALGVSTRPLREAILLLEGEGWLQAVARSGTFVSLVTRADLEQRLEVVAIAVGFAAEKACRWPEPSAGSLASFLPRLRASEIDSQACELFADEIVTCSRSPRLRREYDNAVRPFRGRLDPSDQGDRSLIASECENIVLAVRAGNGSSADEAARKLLLAAGQALIEDFSAVSEASSE